VAALRSAKIGKAEIRMSAKRYTLLQNRKYLNMQVKDMEEGTKMGKVKSR